MKKFSSIMARYVLSTCLGERGRRFRFRRLPLFVAAVASVSVLPVELSSAQVAPRPPILLALDGGSVEPAAQSWDRTHSFTGLPLTSDGWTDLVALYQHPDYYNDSRIIYVSSSSGNDGTAQVYAAGNADVGSNPFEPTGIIRPFSTLSAARSQLRDGYPDLLLLKRGDTFSSGTVGDRKSGRSRVERMIVASYGSSGPRPVLSSAGKQINISTNSAGDAYGFLIFADLEIYGAHKDVNSPTYQSSNQSESGVRLVMPGNDILFENILSRFGQYTIQGYQGRLRNVAMRRNVIIDSYSFDSHAQGVYTAELDNLLVEENIFDRNGWNANAGAVATLYNHNAYLQYTTTGVIFRGNVSARAASHGVHNRSGGLNENNLYLQNPLVQFGYSAGSAGDYGPFSGAFRNNVILDSRNIDTSARGFGLRLEALRDAEIDGNIVAHQRTGTGSIMGISYGHFGTSLSHAENVSITNNIVYNWERSGSGVGMQFESDAPYQNMTISGNQIYQPNSRIISVPSGALSNFTISNNQYFGSNSFSPGSNFSGWQTAVQPINDTFADPGWVDPDRDIESYMRTLGVSGGYEAALNEFLQRARQQEKGNWRYEFTAAAVNGYIRAGFGRSAQ